MIATAKSQQREIDRMQLFVDRFRAKNTKAAQAQSKMKQIERLKEEMVETPDGDGPTVGFRFPQPQRSGHRVITLKHVKFGYVTKPDGRDALPRVQAGHAGRPCHKPDLRKSQFRGRTRPAHRARRAERRGQIHVAQIAGRRSAAAGGRTQARPQREVTAISRSIARRC